MDISTRGPKTSERWKKKDGIRNWVNLVWKVKDWGHLRSIYERLRKKRGKSWIFSSRGSCVQLGCREKTELVERRCILLYRFGVEGKWNGEGWVKRRKGKKKEEKGDGLAKKRGRRVWNRKGNGNGMGKGTPHRPSNDIITWKNGYYCFVGHICVIKKYHTLFIFKKSLT